MLAWMLRVFECSTTGSRVRLKLASLNINMQPGLDCTAGRCARVVGSALQAVQSRLS